MRSPTSTTPRSTGLVPSAVGATRDIDGLNHLIYMVCDGTQPISVADGQHPDDAADIAVSDHNERVHGVDPDA